MHNIVIWDATVNKQFEPASKKLRGRHDRAFVGGEIVSYTYGSTVDFPALKSFANVLDNL
jgi:hypothetical protein